jgi:hypothetical protein
MHTTLAQSGSGETLFYAERQYALQEHSIQGMKGHYQAGSDPLPGSTVNLKFRRTHCGVRAFTLPRTFRRERYNRMRGEMMTASVAVRRLFRGFDFWMKLRGQLGRVS